MTREHDPRPVTRARLESLEATAAALRDQIDTLGSELHELALDLEVFAAPRGEQHFAEHMGADLSRAWHALHDVAYLSPLHRAHRRARAAGGRT